MFPVYSPCHSSSEEDIDVYNLMPSSLRNELKQVAEFYEGMEKGYLFLEEDYLGYRAKLASLQSKFEFYPVISTKYAGKVQAAIAYLDWLISLQSTVPQELCVKLMVALEFYEILEDSSFFTVDDYRDHQEELSKLAEEITFYPDLCERYQEKLSHAIANLERNLIKKAHAAHISEVKDAERTVQMAYQQWKALAFAAGRETISFGDTLAREGGSLFLQSILKQNPAAMNDFGETYIERKVNEVAKLYYRESNAPHVDWRFLRGQIECVIKELDCYPRLKKVNSAFMCHLLQLCMDQIPAAQLEDGREKKVRHIARENEESPAKRVRFSPSALCEHNPKLIRLREWQEEAASAPKRAKLRIACDSLAHVPFVPLKFLPFPAMTGEMDANFDKKSEICEVADHSVKNDSLEPKENTVREEAAVSVLCGSLQNLQLKRKRSQRFDRVEDSYPCQDSSKERKC